MLWLSTRDQWSIIQLLMIISKFSVRTFFIDYINLDVVIFIQSIFILHVSIHSLSRMFILELDTNSVLYVILWLFWFVVFFFMLVLLLLSESYRRKSQLWGGGCLVGIHGPNETLFKRNKINAQSIIWTY